MRMRVPVVGALSLSLAVALAECAIGNDEKMLGVDVELHAGDAPGGR